MDNTAGFGLTETYVKHTEGLLDAAPLNDETVWIGKSANRHGLLARSPLRASTYTTSFTLAGFETGVTKVNMIVTNHSDLPIRRIVGRLYRKDTRGHFAAFEEIDVVIGRGDRPVTIDAPTQLAGELNLQLDFDDDAGYRWRKYESIDRPLRLMRGPAPPVTPTGV